MNRDIVLPLLHKRKREDAIRSRIVTGLGFSPAPPAWHVLAAHCSMTLCPYAMFSLHSRCLVGIVHRRHLMDEIKLSNTASLVADTNYNSLDRTRGVASERALMASLGYSYLTASSGPLSAASRVFRTANLK